MQHRTPAEDVEIDLFQDTDLGAVSGKPEQGDGGEEGEKPKDQAGEQGEVHPLPEHLADPGMADARLYWAMKTPA